MLRISFFIVSGLLCLCCAGGQQSAQGEAYQLGTKPARSELASESESDSDAQETAIQAGPPESLEGPPALTELSSHLPGSAYLTIRLRSGAARGDLILATNQQRALLDPEFITGWIATIAEDLGLSAYRRSDSVVAIHYEQPHHFDSNETSQNINDLVFEFLGRLQNPSLSSFRRTQRQQALRLTRANIGAKSLLLQEVKRQLKLKVPNWATCNVLASDLKDWVDGSQIHWDYPLRLAAPAKQQNLLQHLQAELKSLQSIAKTPKYHPISKAQALEATTWRTIALDSLASLRLEKQKGTGSLLLLILAPQHELENCEAKVAYQKWLLQTKLDYQKSPSHEQFLWLSGRKDELEKAFIGLQELLSRGVKKCGIPILLVEKPEPLSSMP